MGFGHVGVGGQLNKPLPVLALLAIANAHEDLLYAWVAHSGLGGVSAQGALRTA